MCFELLQSWETTTENARTAFDITCFKKNAIKIVLGKVRTLLNFIICLLQCNVLVMHRKRVNVHDLFGSQSPDQTLRINTEGLP